VTVSSTRQAKSAAHGLRLRQPLCQRRPVVEAAHQGSCRTGNATSPPWRSEQNLPSPCTCASLVHKRFVAIAVGLCHCGSVHGGLNSVGAERRLRLWNLGGRARPGVPYTSRLLGGRRLRPYRVSSPGSPEKRTSRSPDEIVSGLIRLCPHSGARTVHGPGHRGRETMFCRRRQSVPRREAGSREHVHTGELRSPMRDATDRPSSGTVVSRDANRVCSVADVTVSRIPASPTHFNHKSARDGREPKKVMSILGFH
jgi:hypothetical protein